MRRFDISKTRLVLASIIRIIASHNKLRRGIFALKSLNNTVGRLPRKAQKEMTIVSSLCICASISFSLFLGCATETPHKVEAKALVEGSMREVVIRPDKPIHIACWMVISGPNASLGTDTKRGVEIAVDDVGGKLLGHPIKITTQDSRCNAEGGQAAAAKLASDPSIVAAVGPNCSSAARPGAPILWKAGIVTVSPSNTDPRLTVPVGECNVTGHLTFNLGSFRFSGKSSMLAAFNGRLILLDSEYAGYNKPGGKMRQNSPDVKKRSTMILNGKETRVFSEVGLCLTLL